jgi:hypothetical protein
VSGDFGSNTVSGGDLGCTSVSPNPVDGIGPPQFRQNDASSGTG